MIVYDKLYRAIKTHLNDVLKIKRVDWFNNQYENFEDNKAIPRRAVFVEIADPITWEQMTPGQSGEVRVVLHCMINDVKESPIRAIEYTQEVFKSLQRKDMMDSDGNQLTTEMLRTQSAMPKRYDQVKVTTLTFTAQVYDDSSIDDVQSGNVDFNVNV